MIIKFYEPKGNDEIVHIVNTNHIVSVDEFPDGCIKIVLDNGTVYETNSHCFSIHDYEKLQKLNVESLEKREDCLFDKMKQEFISAYPKNYMGGLELGGNSCVFSLNHILKIIDKYRESEE